MLAEGKLPASNFCRLWTATDKLVEHIVHFTELDRVTFQETNACGGQAAWIKILHTVDSNRQALGANVQFHTMWYGLNLDLTVSHFLWTEKKRNIILCWGMLLWPEP